MADERIVYLFRLENYIKCATGARHMTFCLAIYRKYTDKFCMKYVFLCVELEVKYCLLGCDAVQSRRISMTFQRNVFLPSSEPKNQPIQPQASSWLTIFTSRGSLTLLFVWLTLLPWRWTQNLPSKRWWTYTRLHGITWQQILIYICLRVSNREHGSNRKLRGSVW
jgi:hypothetical protein